MALTDEGILKVDGLLSRWVRLPGGVKAHYMTAGEDGPAVVLLHGGIIGSSGTAGWRFMAPFLAKNGFRVYCPDQPAFGLTEDPQGYYEPGRAGHVDFCHDFTTALGIDRFHLAGNSMGCLNTVNYVVAHPERVISYALIGGRIGDLLPDEEEQALREKLNHVVPDIRIFDGTKESMKTMMERIIHRPAAISDDLLEMRTRAANNKRDEYARLTVKTFEPATGSDVARFTTKGRLDKLPIPAIYLYGRQDVVFPVDLGYLQEERLPNVQFFFPDECGHQGQTDQPDMFNQVFLEFFRDGKVSRATADWAGVSKNRPEIAEYVAAR
ncbi:alpha/beta fold hydrolase [Amycolatopsis pithecellobii]|uniref:Alpha/beta fold hydrolase n=1 Tax=Amycolatopsis pithecellobii TaxID=664692 RepID=A0A6N7Z778_9PSEU|nr:alpha/beta hydrolase [Amycolatopsis pithecellobii]MTD55676.1 alpha/beta fold hydrolase [Amycolatopsis pithecellobii]